MLGNKLNRLCSDCVNRRTKYGYELCTKLAEDYRSGRKSRPLGVLAPEQSIVFGDHLTCKDFTEKRLKLKFNGNKLEVPFILYNTDKTKPDYRGFVEIEITENNIDMKEREYVELVEAAIREKMAGTPFTPIDSFVQEYQNTEQMETAQ